MLLTDGSPPIGRRVFDVLDLADVVDSHAALVASSQVTPRAIAIFAAKSERLTPHTFNLGLPRMLKQND